MAGRGRDLTKPAWMQGTAIGAVISSSSAAAAPAPPPRPAPPSFPASRAAPASGVAQGSAPGYYSYSSSSSSSRGYYDYPSRDSRDARDARGGAGDQRRYGHESHYDHGYDEERYYREERRNRSRSRSRSRSPRGRGDDRGRERGQPHPPPAAAASASAAAAAPKRPVIEEEPILDVEEEEPEDEEAVAARLLEESKKRRAAILAKYSSSNNGNNNGGSSAPPAAPVAPAVVAPAVSVPAVTTSAPAPEPLPAAAVVAAAASSSSSSSSRVTAPPPTKTAAAAAAAAAAPSMFADDSDEDDESGDRREWASSSSSSASSAASKRAASTEEGGAGIGTGAGAGSGAMAAVPHDDDADDPEGYYRLTIGETIGGRYQVLGTRGKGVFSSVVYCRDAKAATAMMAMTMMDGGERGFSSSGSAEAEAGMAAAAASAAGGSTGGGGGVVGADEDDTAAIAEAAQGTVATAAAPMQLTSSGALVKGYAALAVGSCPYVAVKLIRNNDTMRRAGMKELDILRTLATADPKGRYHCVRLLHTFEHRSHLCLVFEPLNMNLKEVQNKFGKGVGISIAAVRNYARQLLLSLNLLAKLRVVHADIKPHNILANDRYNTIKLADFGSAFKEDDPEANLPTPLLVSRFYRAPEIILGFPHTPALDMWSVACCLFELYTGSPLFPGVDNNDMLWLMQKYKGKFPVRMVKHHLRACAQYGFECHFDDGHAEGGASFRFRRNVLDPVTKQAVTKLVDVPSSPAESIGEKLLAKRSADDDKRSVLALRDLLEAMLALDPKQRISVREAIAHPFIQGLQQGLQGRGAGGR